MTRTTPRYNLTKIIAFGTCALMVLFISIYIYGRLFASVVKVNGQRISRVAYYKEMERLAGDRTLTLLITKSLIYQEAKRQNIEVTKQEIDAEVKRLEDILNSQNKTLAQALEEQRLSKADLIDQIKTRKITEKIATKHVKVSEKEVYAHIQNNRAHYPAVITPQIEIQVRDMLFEQKLNKVIETLLLELRKKAVITK